ncbi:MAG: Hsp33 family molecular chaperone HslO [Kofleriaceae bacterium]
MSKAVGDRVVRAITMDGAFRVIATIPTETANAACAAQGLTGERAVRLGELIACAVIIRETTQPTRRVQLVWRDRSGGTMVADALPDGTSRGIVNPGSSVDALPHAEHLLQVNYTLPNGSLHQGVVSIEQGTSLSEALMQYMQTSEQILATAALGAKEGAGADAVANVGGYLVQVLPEVTHEGLAAMTTHLEQLASLESLVSGAHGNPRAIIDRVLDGFPFAELADTPVQFGCTCSEARIILGILSLGEDEVRSMETGPVLEVRCDACGAKYNIEPASIRAMRELRERGEAPS